MHQNAGTYLEPDSYLKQFVLSEEEKSRLKRYANDEYTNSNTRFLSLFFLVQFIFFSAGVFDACVLDHGYVIERICYHFLYNQKLLFGVVFKGPSSLFFFSPQTVG